MNAFEQYIIGLDQDELRLRVLARVVRAAALPALFLAGRLASGVVLGLARSAAAFGLWAFRRLYPRRWTALARAVSGR